MNNILTPEESAQSVTYGDLMKIMEGLTQAMQQLEERRDEDMIKAFEKIFDILVDLEYKRVRDAKFFLSMLAQMHYSSYEKWSERYANWCEEYDKLNKGEKHEG